MKKIFLSFFWFCAGALLGLFFSLSFAFIIFKQVYVDRVFPGVFIGNLNVSGKTYNQVVTLLTQKNNEIAASTFTFTYNNFSTTLSAKEIHAGYNANLLANQAYIIGKSQRYILSDIILVFKAYLTGILLSPSYTFDQEIVKSKLNPIRQQIYKPPVDAQFTFENGRVGVFHLSEDGEDIHVQDALHIVSQQIPLLILGQRVEHISIPLEKKVLKPKVSTEDANNLGIKELIGMGTSLYQHSIPSRAYNVNLAANRVNGVLIGPGEEFSFAKAVGDVSSFTGYQQAYIIQNGKTVLGDGGGVCQVSTTLFRAILHAGLPVTERHAHAYRVGYYEEDSPPGFDATVYVPTIDLKFKNDTGHSILIQSAVDPTEMRLTFYLYGTNDGRETVISQPIITNQSPAPAPLYTDDPTLPVGFIKQVDFAAPGARVSFTRTVTRNNQILSNDTFVTDYQPWQAAFVRGTKQ